jgi:hypothetical protein
MLEILEGEELVRGPSSKIRVPSSKARASAAASNQLTFFSAPVPHPVVDRLKGVDPNATTPLQALTLLSELVEEAKRSVT